MATQARARVEGGGALHASIPPESAVSKPIKQWHPSTPSTLRIVRMRMYVCVCARAGCMQVLQVADDTIGIRSLDWDRDRFDIEFGCVRARGPHSTPQPATLPMQPPAGFGSAGSRARPSWACEARGFELVLAWHHMMHSTAQHSAQLCGRRLVMGEVVPPTRHLPFASACSLDNGTTYNSYLIFGETHTALVDASHEKFHNLYLKTLQVGRVGAAGLGRQAG